MTRRAIACAVAVLALLGAGPASAARQHRLVLPPPVGPPLPAALAVDETEYRLTPSQLTVAAGRIKVRVYNRGMDDHDLTVVTPQGDAFQVFVPAGADATLFPVLLPGRYTFFCSLFDHRQLGMAFDLDVR